MEDGLDIEEFAVNCERSLNRLCQPRGATPFLHGGPPFKVRNPIF